MEEDWQDDFERAHEDWLEESWYNDLVSEMENWLGVDVNDLSEQEREDFYDGIVDWLNDMDIDPEYWDDIFDFYYETAA